MAATITSPQLRMLYRRLLRAAVKYPSIKRKSIIAEIKSAFRENKNLTDPKKLEKEINEACNALTQLKKYDSLNTKSSVWKLDL